MKSLLVKIAHRMWIAAVIVFAGLAFHPMALAQCTYNQVVDSTFDVEQTVCLEGSGSDAYASIEIDNSGYVAYQWSFCCMAGLTQQVIVYDEALGQVADSGTSYPAYSTWGVGFSATAGHNYFAQAFYSEYIYDEGAGQGSEQGEWYGPYYGASVELQY